MNISSDMRDMEKDLEEKLIQSDIVRMITVWSELFGAPIQEEKKLPTRDRENLSYKLIEEELQELFEAQNERDLTAIQDALGDLLWVVIRAMMEYGISPLSTIRSIYISNMSKLDTSFKDLLKSAMIYSNKGIETYYKQTEDGRYILKRELDDKILKSHKFKEPKFN